MLFCVWDTFWTELSASASSDSTVPINKHSHTSHWLKVSCSCYLLFSMSSECWSEIRIVTVCRTNPNTQKNRDRPMHESHACGCQIRLSKKAYWSKTMRECITILNQRAFDIQMYNFIRAFVNAVGPVPVWVFVNVCVRVCSCEQCSVCTRC